ncbi:MAG: hypothetical protein IJY39_08815 [Clostridia bacterium]|nr:hypothetical protein [Clostridia bacterium]
MSLKDGMAAINLEMPDRVPRTEYSAEVHWDLINAVVGTRVSHNSSAEERRAASQAFFKAWNYDFEWCTTVPEEELGDFRTRMGHAGYMAGHVDFDSHVSSYFKSVDDVLSFDPLNSLPNDYTHSGLVERFNQAYKANCGYCPDAVNTVGTYISAVSGFIGLFGWEFFLEALGEDSDQMGRIMERYSQWMQKYYNAMAECDAPVILIHDDIVWTEGPFVSPAWYREYVFPCFKRYVDPLKQAGKKVLYCSDGNFTTFIDDIAACNFDGFILEPSTDMAYIAEKYGKTHSFIGNADTRILLHGTREDIENEVKRCMDIGKKCPGFIMAVGNHIPPNTPVDNALWYNECYEKLSKR